jgi:hypothetical protein
MRLPKPGDNVLHFLHKAWTGGISETRLCGSSRIKSEYKEVDQEPPMPGGWAGRGKYYRIELTGYKEFPTTLPLNVITKQYKSEIFTDLIKNTPRFYPFTTHGDEIRTVQGIYLARCTEFLVGVLKDALGIEEAPPVATSDGNPHYDYSEGLRMSREIYFFSRNPRLAKAAKEKYGLVCMVCAFDFVKKYGNLGRGYAECHHLSPLSERPPSQWTKTITTNVDEVAVLCANCHRMIHRRRRAMTLDDLRDAMDEAN